MASPFSFLAIADGGVIPKPHPQINILRIGDIADRLDVNINTVKLCLNEYEEGGIPRALFDDQRADRSVDIMTMPLHGLFVFSQSLRGTRSDPETKV